ncbi:acyl-CoA N-acyltransferase [Mycena amicta]|nr:acyl-CoA N-acyltransferase [Mycena amicta]
MAEVFVRRLETPTDAQIEQLVTLMLESFQAVTYDTFGTSLNGGDKSLDIFLHRASLKAGFVDGEVWVAGFTPQVSQICAVAIWFPPQTDYLNTEQQRAAGWDQAQLRFSPELSKWYSDYLAPRISAHSADFLGKDAQLNSWHLNILATNPNHQKKGLAAALIDAIETKAKADGIPMCVETTNALNVAFYRNRGFRVRGTLDLVGTGGQHVFTFFSKP